MRVYIGIIVQLPLPKHIDRDAVVEGVSPVKDVTDSLQRISVGSGLMIKIIFYLLQRVLYWLCWTTTTLMLREKVVVIGRSTPWVKPTALALINHWYHRDCLSFRYFRLSDHTIEADIVNQCCWIAKTYNKTFC